MSKIRFIDIYKHFGKRHILKGVKLNLYGGQCSLLTGANGTGKSTLLRICAGLEIPDKGNVDVGLGCDPWTHHRPTLLTRSVYLHQQPYMFDGDVLKNLSYALPANMEKTKRKQRIEETLHWAELENIATNSAKTLSGGERQRIAIARAWIREPTIMLLDEPTANMDQGATQRTLQLLHSLKDQGIALLVASHDMSNYYTLVDEQMNLSEGLITSKKSHEHNKNNIVPLHQTQNASL